MALKLRLKRMGNRHRPFFRIVAVDNTRQRDGAVKEELGYYNPVDKDEARQSKIKLDRCAYWISVGAQPTDTVASLLKNAGLTPKPGTPLEKQEAVQPATQG